MIYHDLICQLIHLCYLNVCLPLSSILGDNSTNLWLLSRDDCIPASSQDEVAMYFPLGLAIDLPSQENVVICNEIWPLLGEIIRRRQAGQSSGPHAQSHDCSST